MSNGFLFHPQEKSILSYVHILRESLQVASKQEYKAVLPVPGSTLNARFGGLYAIKQKVFPTNYVITISERKCKTCMCHINLLKRHHVCTTLNINLIIFPSPMTSAVTKIKPGPESDGLSIGRNCTSSAHPLNSEALKRVLLT